jgi:FKBP-type peptidyl-prolyl cis-trans isomerase
MPGMMACLIRRIVPCAVLALLAACGGHSAPPGSTTTTSSSSTAAPAVNELQVEELQPGTGVPIAAGQKAAVAYTGWLYESAAPDHKGKEFDSSRHGSEPSGEPFRFTLGAGQVIKGWDQGVLGMKVGGRRRLIIPADLGYGDVGAGDAIPPGATLIFDVDLVGIE